MANLKKKKETRPTFESIIGSSKTVVFHLALSVFSKSKDFGYLTVSLPAATSKVNTPSQNTLVCFTPLLSS